MASALLVSAGAFAFSPCPRGMPASDQARPSCQKEWTLLVYMAADNDLTAYAPADLQEMTRGKAGDNDESVDIVFELDTDQNDGSQRGAVVHGGVREMGRLPEQNSGNASTLESFLGWALRSFPSKHYAVVLWGHGNGWGQTAAGVQPLGQGRAGNGIGFDATSRSWMTVPKVREALDGARAAYLDGAPFDLYAADACLMQTAEVIWELKDSANFVFGSVPVMDFQGLPYGMLVRRFAQGAYDDENGALKLAGELPEMIARTYRTRNPKIMASAISTGFLQQNGRQGNWARAFDDLGEAGLAWLAEDSFRSLDFSEVLAEANAYQKNTYDMYQFLVAWTGRLSESDATESSEELRGAIRRLQDIVLSSVVNATYGDFYLRTPVAGWARGLSLWIPLNSVEHRAGFSSLKTSSLYRSSGRDGQLNGWARFLDKIYAPRP
jgi:hypothetical protein